MVITHFCWCCGKDTEVYKNKNTGRIARHCIKCTEDYKLDERKRMEMKLIFNLVNKTDTEELDID